MEVNKLAQRVSLPEQIDFPKIEPVPQGIHRPFWSVMIPTYNRINLLEEALRSVLEQDPGCDEMQIEVVDDCSTVGDAEAIVREIGKGRVSFYRRPYNVGQAGNWNTCIQRARGHWVHILHDDDTILPGFYSRLRSALEKESSVGAAFCRHIYMDEEGHWQYLSVLEMPVSGILPDWIERVSPGVIQTPAVVVKRSVYEKLGGVCPELKYMLDLEMWMRIALHYPWWYEPQPLACYRSQNLQSVTSFFFKSNLIINDGYKLLAILQSYLPEAIADRVFRKAREGIIIFLIVVIRHNIRLGNIKAAMAQMQELLRCDFSFRVIKGIIRSLILIGEGWLSQAIRSVVSPVKNLSIKQK